jgi:hypothetical protein
LLFEDSKEGRSADDRLEQIHRMWVYLFVVEADAWKLLAAELKFNPETVLQDVPCYDSLRQMEGTVRLTAFTQKEATEYLRKRGNQEAQAPTVEATLTEMRAFLDSRIAWWD